LLLGGAGFIGAALTTRLLAAGHEAVVLDNLSNGKLVRLDGLGCEMVVADVRDAEAVAKAARGCDSVIHLAFIQGTRNFYAHPSEVLSVAVGGMTATLEAVRAAGIRELVYVSSAEAHQSAMLPTPEDTPLTVPDVLNPRFSYGGGKIACELLAAAAWHDRMLDRVVITRPHNIIGPDMSDDHIVPDLAWQMARQARENPDGPLPLQIQGTGRETRCYTFISDAIDQFMLILGNAGPLGAYHVGSQDERTTAEVAEEIARCYRRTVKIIPGPLPKGSPLRRQPGLGFLEALGYRPRVSFADAIARTVAWYQEAP
jgi:nucleoside-diphosphate-sugar epimerase